MAQVFADLEQDEAETQQIAREQPTVRNSRNRRLLDRYGLPSTSAEWRKSGRKEMNKTN